MAHAKAAEIQKVFNEALTGTLWSTNSPTQLDSDLHITNKTEVPIRVTWIDYLGRLSVHKKCHPDATIKIKSKSAYQGMYFMVTNALSGSLMFAFAPKKGGKLDVTCKDITVPGRIGAYPVPNSSIPIPPNSPLVMVACAKLPNKRFVTREQFWLRQPDSFSLAASEERTVSITVSRGLQRTSSQTDTFATAIGTTTGAGWGPVSASISANLSYSATSFQQVTVSEETTVYEAKTLKNGQPHPVMFLIWQLIDVITVYSADEVPLATISLGEAPTLITEAYNPAVLTAPTIPPLPSATWPKPEITDDND